MDRIVIVVDVNEVARVYVRGFLDASAVPAIVQAVKDVQVSADGDVTVTPQAVDDAIHFEHFEDGQHTNIHPQWRKGESRD